MIDFDALVIGPSMAIFARPIIITPTISQPSAAPFAGRGIWSSRAIDVQTEDGILSTQEQTLAIRGADYLIPPIAGDAVEIPAAGSLHRIGVCAIEDVDDDGQGGFLLSVKIVGP